MSDSRMSNGPAGLPVERGINRIICAVWDLESAMAFYGKLLGAEFVLGHGEEARTFGVAVAFSWDAGMELVSPLPEHRSSIREHLESHGEGIVGVVFAVADADAARDAAAELGMANYHSLDYDQDILDDRYPGRFSTFKEHFIAPVPPLAGTVLLGEFAPLRTPSDS